MSEPALTQAPPTFPQTPDTAARPPEETTEEKWKRRQFYLSLIASAAIILGGVWTVFQYFNQQAKQAGDQLKQQKDEANRREEQAKKDSDQRERLAKRELDQREKESELRRRELALMIYREKKEAYALLVDAATEVSIAKSRRELEDRAARFYGAYYGRIHIVPELDTSVVTAKNEFKKLLDDYISKGQTDLPIDVFNSKLNDLATACQKALDCRLIDKK